MALDTHCVHISGGTFTQIAGNLNEYNVAGDLVQRNGENGRSSARYDIPSSVVSDLENGRNHHPPAEYLWRRIPQL
jgi:hypothetical protein